MHSRAGAAVAIVVLLAVSILACVGPQPTPTTPPPTTTAVPAPTDVPTTPTPEAREPNYSSATLGLSLWYPDTWISEEMPDLVAFASSSALMSGEDWETGAAFAIMLGDIESGQTIKELIQQLIDESALDEVKTTDPRPVTIGQDRGGSLIWKPHPRAPLSRSRGSWLPQSTTTGPTCSWASPFSKTG
jgi:hypothetical protein